MKGINKAYRILLLIFIILILLARLHLVVVRYFDSDEFAHLHWAYLVSQGSLPYRDFFFYITPVYQWFLLPIIKLPIPDIVISVRLWEYILYIAVTFLVFQTSYLISKNIFAGLLSALLFLVFPMTFDKTLEIRPDILMTFFFLLSIYLMISLQKVSKLMSFLAGASISASFLTLFKIIFVLPAASYLFWKSNKILHVPSFFGGLLLPPAMVLLYLVANDIVPYAYQGIIYDSFAVNTGKQSFSALRTLSPWPLVYIGRGGVSWPWIVNTSIWILLLPAIFLSIKQHTIRVFLLIFFIGAIVYLYLFPVPYVQYFIPLSAFASIAVGTLLAKALQVKSQSETKNNASSVVKSIFFLFVLLSLGVSFWQQYKERTMPEISNLEQLQVLKDIVRITKPQESFYDMVGSYVVRPDGYNICCHPYNEFWDRLENKPITLRESLIERQTKFLVMDRTGLVFWLPLPDDLQFLTTRYLPSNYKKIYTVGSQYQCQQSSCVQLNVHGSPLSSEFVNSIFLPIHIKETYKVTIRPENANITLDDQIFSNNESVLLTAGTHKVTVENDVSYFKIQLDR